MPSISLLNWTQQRARSLDEIENAHGSVGGSGPGRRYATQQINQAYAVLLSSQFQGYCRDLHTECADCLARAAVSANLQDTVHGAFVQNRKLDQGNPNPGNLGSDFNRLGVDFWDEVKALDRRNAQRLAQLEMLNHWRNAIAHQDFNLGRLGGGTSLQLQQVRTWRRSLDKLAMAFDTVMCDYIRTIIGTAPW